MSARVFAATGVGIALLFCGCGTSTPAHPPQPTPSPSIPRPSCVSPGEGSWWTPPGTDDADLNGGVLTLGAGPHGVLLIPQSDGDICQWYSTGVELAHEGYRVAMMNWGQPYEDSVTAAFHQLRASGVHTIVLVGASMGAAYALDLAATLNPAAVACFSADPPSAGIESAETAITRYRKPLLLVGSTDDGYAPAALTRYLARQHPGPEHVLIVSGSQHGIDLLNGPDGARITAALTSFLHTSSTE